MHKASNSCYPTLVIFHVTVDTDRFEWFSIMMVYLHPVVSRREKAVAENNVTA